MTIEEKAKAYDEAIDKIGDIVEAGTIEQGLAEWLFPELKESEDERIRNFLISKMEEVGNVWKEYSAKDIIAWLEKKSEKEYALKSFSDEDVHKFVQYIERQAKAYELNLPNRSYDIYGFAKDILSWLEKQGEQKPVYKIEPRFNVDDWITNGRYIEHIIGINQDWPYYMFEDGTTKRIKDIDKKYRLWTIEDAKDGDVLATENFIFIFKNIDNDNGVHYYCQYEISKHEDDNQFDVALPQSLMGRVGNSIFHYSPATKKQYNTLCAKMKEAGYEWDAKKKELKKTYVIDEGKDEIDYCFTKMMKGEKVTPAWSEEDETKLTTAQTFIRNTSLIGNDEIKEATIDWLKFLKDRMQSQNHWKPTDEQITAIRLARSFVTDDVDEHSTLLEILMGLEDELTKLKNE